MSDRALDGQHALITGASKGIGAAIARRLARAGARVSLLGRTEAALAARCREIADEGGAAAAFQGDVTDGSSLEAAIRAARGRFGPLSILINNAGAAESASFAATEPDLWRRMIDVNLTGVYLATRTALPDMIGAGGGRVIAIASTAGRKGYAHVAAYCAAKHGVVGLTRALAAEYARSGITFNAVCPGYTDTDMAQAAVANIAAKTGKSAAEARAKLEAGNPQGRLIRPEEVAETVHWLCLPDSRGITGQAIMVAGGEVT